MSDSLNRHPLQLQWLPLEGKLLLGDEVAMIVPSKAVALRQVLDEIWRLGCPPEIPNPFTGRNRKRRMYKVIERLNDAQKDCWRIQFLPNGHGTGIRWHVFDPPVRRISK